MMIKSNKKQVKDPYSKLHKNVLSRVKPDKITRTRLDKVIKNLISETNKVISKQELSYDLEPILVGSTAKDTYLKNPDIDLFIMFPVDVSVDELRKQGLTIGQQVLPDGEERYAEHPYITGEFQGFEADIVPCYKLDDIKNRMTAVDRTPFHTRFIIEHLQPHQQDEVRILKQFMKGIGTYGAEIEVQGFSGYLCELLVLRYGGFLELLQTAARWGRDLVFELDGDEGGKTYSKSGLTKKLYDKFKDEPLIFIDPVDAQRNVASALAFDKLELFKTAAQEYIKHPKLEFFFPNQVEPLPKDKLERLIESQPESIIGIEFKTPEIIPDILHGQLRKCQKAVQKLLDTTGFSVAYSNYYINDQSLMLFELTKSKLSSTELHTGPPDGHKNVEEFKRKWINSYQAVSKPYLKNKRWYLNIKREFKEPIPLLKAKITDLNVGKHVKVAIKNCVNFYQDKELLKKGFKQYLTKFITRKLPWEY